MLPFTSHLGAENAAGLLNSENPVRKFTYICLFSTGKSASRKIKTLIMHPKCYLETKSITVVQISLVSHCADGQETAIVALFFFPDEQRWFPCRLRRSLSESCCTTVSNLVVSMSVRAASSSCVYADGWCQGCSYRLNFNFGS